MGYSWKLILALPNHYDKAIFSLHYRHLHYCLILARKEVGPNNRCERRPRLEWKSIHL